MTDGWYYLHTNGELIFKRTEPEVEDGGFVQHVWPIDTTDRFTAWKLVTEALAYGAKRDRVMTLRKKWGLTDGDGMEYANRAGFWLIFNGETFEAGFKHPKGSKKKFDMESTGGTAVDALAAVINKDYKARQFAKTFAQNFPDVVQWHRKVNKAVSKGGKLCLPKRRKFEGK